MRNRVPILMYHAVHERRSVISIPPALFAWQMGWLHENGYGVIPLSRLVQHLRSGDELPDRTAVITFDDGFESVYTSAFPVLTRYGFPATVFLVPDYCGQSNDWPSQPRTVPRLGLLSWEQIGEMHRHGLEFGGHTLTHPRLDRLAPDEAEREIVGSKAEIEDHLGRSVELFAYPYGRYDAAAETIVRRAHAGACTAHLRLVAPRSDPLALERVDAYYVQDPLLFRAMWNPTFSLYLGLRRPMRAIASAALRRPWN